MMELLNPDVANIVNRVHEYENKHKEKVFKEHGAFTDHFEIAFNELAILVTLVNYVEKETWSNDRMVQFLALKNTLAPLYSSYDRLISGFYGDSMILLRTVYETLLRILFISYSDGDPYASFVYPAPEGEPQFQVKNFLKDHLKVKWNFIYELLCQFAHSNAFELKRDVMKLHTEGLTEPIKFNLKYDAEMMSGPVNLTYVLLWGLMKISLPLFLSEEKDKDVLLILLGFETCERAFGAVIKEMPNSLSRVYDDMERIVDEVKEKEGINV